MTKEIQQHCKAVHDLLFEAIAQDLRRWEQVICNTEDHRSRIKALEDRVKQITEDIDAFLS